MAKKTKDKLWIAFVLIVGIFVVASVAQSTGALSWSSFGKQVGTSRARLTCTESCAEKTVTLFVGQQATFCCKIIKLENVDSLETTIITTVTKSFDTKNLEYDHCKVTSSSCSDDSGNCPIPAVTETITGKESVCDMGIYIKITDAVYSINVNDRSATLLLSTS